ncbi:MAG TPA: hemerythrin domain-containing protein [Thermoanaerobaculia bacterium]|nr:hemerythrin domain-containing protein [Thermoanaerobaculia bacterium]
MDATALLAEDHDHVRERFSDLDDLGPSEAAERRALLGDLRQELEVLARVEEEVFYPAVRRLPDENANDLVEEALERHDEVKLLADDLARVDPADPDFEERLAELRESVEMHVTQEESEIFPIARERLGIARLDELGKELEAMRETLMGAQVAR